MIFSPDMLAKVLSGEKTQTRRPVKTYEAAWINFYTGLIDVVANEHGTKWQVGRTYAVTPGRGKFSVAKIRLLQIRRESPVNISDADVRAEGFVSREDFLFKLTLLYGATVDLTAPYWALTFEVVR